MKKSLLSAVVLALACTSISNAKITVTSELIDQPANDTLLFALPVTPGCTQEIWTNVINVNPVTGNVITAQVGKFQPEYLVTAADFANGDTEIGTATLPANAKVIGLRLDGFDIGSVGDAYGVWHEVSAWCKNVARDKMVLDYLDLFDGYRTHKPQGDLFTDTMTYRGITGNPGVINVIDMNSNENNPCKIVDIPFGNPDDPDMPFCYEGENIYLTLWLINPGWFGEEGVGMKYKYFAYDNAEAEYASLFRAGGICFNSETQDLLIEMFGQGLPYDLPLHRLPAFRTPYYTNDARIVCKGYNTEFELRDPDGNVLVPAEVGVDELGHPLYTYVALAHDIEYSIYTTVNGDNLRGGFKIDNIYKDINVVIDNSTAVEDINAQKTVAKVAYYNLAGQQSAEALDGVNIVVTTYSDGSTTTAKVIK